MTSYLYFFSSTDYISFCEALQCTVRVRFSFYVCKSDEIWGFKETLTILFGWPPT